MANNRSVKVECILTSEEGCEIEVTLDYDEGGMNYFHGTENPRGFNLYTTVWRTDKHGCRTTVIGTGGLKRRVQAATRFSAKTLRLLVEQATQHDSPVYTAKQELVDNVLKKEGLTYAAPLTAIARAVS